MRTPGPQQVPPTPDEAPEVPDVPQPPAGQARAASEAPPEAGDAQWPSQCEQLTGITYRYRKGITEAWLRRRVARVARPQPEPPAET